MVTRYQTRTKKVTKLRERNLVLIRDGEYMYVHNHKIY